MNERVRAFLSGTAWKGSLCRPLTGDASLRKYYRLYKETRTAVLMDSSLLLASLAPFIQIDLHLAKLGFSAPAILERDEQNGFLLMEDFGDQTFTSLLERETNPEKLYTLATDVLVHLHRHPRAIPAGLRAYQPQKMLEDIELFLEWRTPNISAQGKDEFRAVWREVLPGAHKLTASLLLRDYHVANLMLLPEREGVQQAGLLDFQDAYQGPTAYDLVSLLEDARRDVPQALKEKMLERYVSSIGISDTKAFAAALAILAAQRHTRVLAIFERLSRHEGKHDYKQLHSPRVEHMLQKALAHPLLAGVKAWFEKYAH